MQNPPDLIFIDDNRTLTAIWEMLAEEENKKIVIFNSIADARAQIESFLKETPIYIDSSLKEEVSGQDFAKELYDKGFKNLYLATGYEASHFPPMPWIKEIVGKHFPGTFTENN